MLSYRLTIDQPAPADKQSLGQAVFRSGQSHNSRLLPSHLPHRKQQGAQDSPGLDPMNISLDGGCEWEQGSNQGSHIFEANALH